MQLVATSGPLAGCDHARRWRHHRRCRGDGRPCCAVRSSGTGGFVLEVLDEATPVFVNGLPPTARAPRSPRRAADRRLAARHSRRGARRAGDASAVRGRDRPVLPRQPIIELGADAALLPDGDDPTSRDGRDLATLLRIGAALTGVHGLATLDAPLAALVREIVPAERVAIAGGEGGSAVVQSAWSDNASAPGAVRLDPALLDRAVRERVALAAELRRTSRDRRPDDGVRPRDGRDLGRDVAGATCGRRPSPAAALHRGARRGRPGAGARSGPPAARRTTSCRRRSTSSTTWSATAGRCARMFERVARVARSEATVLLRGESGTGKELVARAMHRNSARAEPAVRRDQLRGDPRDAARVRAVRPREGRLHRRDRPKKGQFEMADGGTLFLDEIGELPLRAAGQAAARAAGARVRARRRRRGR